MLMPWNSETHQETTALPQKAVGLRLITSPRLTMSQLTEVYFQYEVQSWS